MRLSEYENGIFSKNERHFLRPARRTYERCPLEYQFNKVALITPIVPLDDVDHLMMRVHTT